MIMKILHKRTGAVLLEVEGDSLQGADLRCAYLKCANLIGANLKGAYLESADLRGTNLEYANLQGANLIGANLKGAYLESADLRGTNLQGADLTGANLEYANLQGADIRYCVGNGKQIKTFIGAKYRISYTKDVLAIGCKQAPIEQWKMDEVELDEADSELWETYKSWILGTVELFPATE